MFTFSHREYEDGVILNLSFHCCIIKKQCRIYYCLFMSLCIVINGCCSECNSVVSKSILYAIENKRQIIE